MTGRKPKPTGLKEAQVSRGHRPLPKGEPKPTGVPTCPSHLDKIAKSEWRRIVKELAPLGLVTHVDRAALSAYCVSYSRWIDAEVNVQKFGTVIKSPKSGFPINSPYVGIANSALDQMRKFCTEFGLTPASRVRLANSNFDAQAELDLLLSNDDTPE
jgi:P27 family predicted phage terminase small subunit